MTQKKFGDLFHEVPESEIFSLPCGGSVSSECVINSLGQTYTVEVIPRQEMIDALAGRCPSHSIALGFRIVEQAGTGLARVSTEPSAVGSQLLSMIDADSLPEIGQVA